VLTPGLPQHLPNDVEALKALVRELLDALERSQRRNEQLEHRRGVLLKARFGPRADRLDPKQLLLFAEEILAEGGKPASEPEAPSEPKPKAASNGNGHGRRPLPKDLPRKQVVHDLSDEEKRCPCCGEMRVRIGQETSEQLEYIPAQ